MRRIAGHTDHLGPGRGELPDACGDTTARIGRIGGRIGGDLAVAHGEDVGGPVVDEPRAVDQEHVEAVIPAYAPAYTPKVLCDYGSAQLSERFDYLIVSFDVSFVIGHDRLSCGTQTSGVASQALSHPCNVQLRGGLMQEDVYTDGIQSRLGIQGTCLEAALTSSCLLVYP